MSDSFVTQCPHCQTRFRVTHHQLSLARGVVRCGSCLQVFNAARQLLERHRAETGQPSAEETAGAQPDTTPATRPTERVDGPSLGEQAGVPATMVSAAPMSAGNAPAASAEDWAMAGNPLDEVDLDQELARLERRGVPAPGDSHPNHASLHARRDDTTDDHDGRPFGTAIEDSEVQPPSLLFADPASPDAPHLPPAERTEPTLSLDMALDEHASRSSSSDSMATAMPDQHAPLDRPEQIGHDRIEPGLGAPAARPRKEPLIGVVDDPLQLDWQKPAPNWRKRLLWGLLVLLATATLLLQYVWYHFDELARQDQYRPWFQSLCPSLGCEVPTRVDISRIRSSNLVVRSHPDFKGALIVDAIIYNRASFPQPFPLLELRFADLNGQLIASRRFKPSEYLSGELAGRGDMPSQTPIHIALDILDPGPKAVNYSLSFRSPE
ncbi:DUF3426 domain-containing protein [Pseudomonas sp. Marseille-QA0332]